MNRFAVRQRDTIILVRADDVNWIEGARDYVRLHSKSGRYLARSTMRSLIQQLDPGEFVRIHRSTIVRIDSVSYMSPLFHGDYSVHLDDGTQLRWSRRYRRSTKALLGFGT